MGSMAVMGIAFTSCSKDVAFDTEAADNQIKAEYESNFVKKYGEIAPDQSWDFSTMTPVHTLSSSASEATTRAGGASTPAPTMTKVNADRGMIIESEVVSWVTSNLKAGANNYVKGSPFYMEVPENTFTIVPIFQGQAGYYWQLCMHVDGVGNDKVIWSKGDILYKNAANERNYKTPTNTGMTDGGSKSVYEVKAPTFTFTNYPAGARMYFYMRVWNSQSDYEKWRDWYWWYGESVAPRYLTSLDYQMLAIKGPNIPAAIKDNYTEENVTFIGCEDTEITKKADRDYEDFVFMMYGKPAPPISHVDTETVSTGKRYLIEDLGATDDFDFNDIVVDVTEVYQNQVYYKNIDAQGNKEFDHKSEIPGTRKQKAIVRAMGGTRNFTLTIGSTTWSKSDSKYATEEMLNTGWNGTEIEENKVLAEFDVTGWNPSTNNISISVERQGESNGFYTIKFPKEGTVPMIIATDMTPLTQWQHEKQSVPKTWIKTE